MLLAIDNLYARALHGSLHHRPTVFALGLAALVGAVVLGRQVNYEFQPTTDEAEVTVDAELAVGTRIESTEQVLIRLENAIRQATPEMTMLITQAGGGGGGFGNSSTNRGSITVRLVPKDERDRASDQIAMDLRRQLSGLPGVIVRTRASGGQMGMMRGMGGSGDGSRLSVEIRGHELETGQTRGAGPEGAARHHRRASPTRGSAATRAGPSWPCASTATRRPCSA